MMVFPQISNFRTAVVIGGFFCLILTMLSVSSYLENKDEIELDEQEKKLILLELSEMIDSYDSVEVLNDSLRFELKQSKEKLVATIDSVKRIKPNKTLISKYKAQIRRLKIEKNKILSLVKKLELENQYLKSESQAFNKIIKSRDSITQLIESKYAHLLVEKVNVGENNRLFISNVNVQGVKRITVKKRVVDTEYARRSKKFHIEFTIVKNRFLTMGPKTFYFQILDSKMNVVADKGTVEFNEKSLIYSGKKTIRYTGEEITVSSLISTIEEEKLVSGVYFISIIHKGEIISKTSLTLK